MVTRTGYSPTGHRLVEANGFVYISGATANEYSGGMAEQTRQILERLDGFLKDGNLTKDQIVFANVFLTDMSLKEEMNAAWSRYFPDEILPARCTVGIADLYEGCLVEIQFIAAR